MKKQQKVTTSPFHFMLQYVRTEKKSILPLILLCVINITLQVMAPQILGQFIDAAKPNGSYHVVIALISSYMAMILLQMGANVLEQNYSDYFGRRITDRLRYDTMKQFLDAPMSKHDNWSEGEMITRMDEDVEGLFSYFYILFFKIISSILLLAGILIALFIRNQLITWIMFVICVLTIFIFKWIQDKGMHRYIESSKAAAEFNGVMKEQLDHAIDLRACSAEQYASHQLVKAMKKRFKENFPASMMYSILWSASTVLDTASTIITLFVSILLWSKGLITLGTVFLIHEYNNVIYNPLQSFRDNLSGLQSAKAGLIRLIELFHNCTPISYGQQTIEGPAKLTVSHLQFGYETKKNVLNEIDFKLNKGEKLAVIGPTGCGKTTLVSLITRLYDYQSGEILLNGIPLRELSKDCLRTRIACCSQDIRFLHGTLRDNITFYDHTIPDSQILQAIETTGLNDWYKKLPDGLDTMLGEAESIMSSGEAQLVSILRLFLQDPSLVILDEISSRLDPVTEHHLLTALDALTKNRTVISIAHREAVVKRCDTIMVLENGLIKEYGSQQELESNKNSRYHQLFLRKEA